MSSRVLIADISGNNKKSFINIRMITPHVILIFGLILLIIIRYSRRERFSEDSKLILTDFLNTTKAQSDEIKKVYTIDGKRAITDKEILIKNTNGSNTHLNHHNDGKHTGQNYIRGVHTHINTPTSITEDTTIQGTTFIKNWAGNADATTSRIANDTNHYKKLMIIGNTSGGGNVRRVGVWDEFQVNGTFCINGTCIDESHLKILTGDTDFLLRNRHKHGKGEVIDCGFNKHSNPDICHLHQGDWNNANQLFSIYKRHGKW